MSDATELIERLRQCPDGDPKAQIRAIMALEDARVTQAASTILPFLRSPHVMVRLSAADALGGLGTTEVDDVGPALMTLLDDPDSSVRSSAAEALGELGYTPARPALERVLREDPHATPRASAAEALGDLGDRDALDALVRAFADDDEPVRSYVALAIGLLGDPARLPELRRQLQKEPPLATRRFLLVAATRLGDEQALDEIMAMGEADEEESRYEFLGAMSDLVAEATPAMVLTRADELARRVDALGIHELAARLRALHTSR